MRKFSGSASAGNQYYAREDDLDLGIEKTLAYHGAKKDGSVFDTVWGTLAQELGITDGITRVQFERLWNGQDVYTGEQLVSAGWRKLHDDTGEVTGERVRTAGFDVTFSTPKSVSELLVRADPVLRQQIIEAWKASVHDAVMHAIDNHARLARVPVRTPTQVGARTTKTQGSETERTVANVIAIPVVQYTARPTEESINRGSGVPDPHLHAHVFVFSLVQTEDGKWRTADGYGLKGNFNPELREQIAMGSFAHRLEQLGVELEYSDFDRARKGNVSWQVKGWNKELCGYWSTNHKRAWEIRRKYEAEKGKPLSDEMLTEILSQTRRRKTKLDKNQDERPVFELWGRDGKEAGFDLAPYQAAPRAATTQRETGVEELERFEELDRRLMSANGLCRDDAVFSADSVFPAVMRCGVGLGLSTEQLKAHAESLRARLIPVRKADKPYAYFTTPRIVQAELVIEATLAQKESATLPAPSRAAVRHGIGSLDFALDPEQIAAVRAVCGPSGLVNIAGRAGTGKTAAMRAAVDAYRNDEVCDQVIVVSMAAATAKRTAKKLGADRYGSVESILAQKEHGLKFTRRSLVIVDEAGQLDTLRAEALLEAVGDARVVLLGDLKQLPGIGASGWWSQALDVHPSVELTMVRRQKDPADVRDYDLLRQGRARKALRNLAERGRIHIAQDSGERIRQVVHDYVKFREGWRADNVRIVAERNVDVDTVNRFVQKYRLDHGEIRPGGFDVEDGETDRRWGLYENDQVVFRRSYVIRGEEPVRNGSTGTILSIHERSGRTRIRLDDSNRTVTVRLQDHELTQPVAPAYCQVIDRYQGHEAEIIQNIAGLSSQNHGYTEATRAIYESHIYVSEDIHGPEPIEKLGEVWSKETVKETALSRLRRIESEAEVGVAELDPVPNLEPEPEPEPIELYDQRLEIAKQDLSRDDDWLKTFEAEMREREAYERDRDLGFGSTL